VHHPIEEDSVAKTKGERGELRFYPAGRFEQVRVKWKKLITKVVGKDKRA